MGKPDALPVPGIAGSSSDTDAVSLHTQPGDRAFDADVPELQSDDLPPLYSDIEPDTDGNAPLLPSGTSYVLDVLHTRLGTHTVDVNTGAECFMNPLLDEDPRVLENQIKLSAEKPPRPYVRIAGTHSQMVNENGKREKKTITDFDISLDLTPYLFSDAARGVSWKALRTVENSEKTRRGTVLRKRAPGVKRDIEITDTKPTLAEWCHRYCASHAGLKCFVLQRRVVGFDENRLKEKLTVLVRGTNYRGNVSITFPVKDDRVFVYNRCKINEWRVTPWIVWLFYLTFLWLFSWPYLFFRTKMFEVAVAEWPFSVTEANGSKRYVSLSEEHIYNLWGRAISRAVLDKRQGALDHEDLIASQTAPAEPLGNLLEGAPRFLREGINAITSVNRSFGWGADSN
jgi:hypothetical protein